MAHRAFNELAIAKLRKMGHKALGVRHTVILPHIETKGTRSSELAKRAGITKQSTSRLVADLVKAGYLRLEVDPSDGRATLVAFTSDGLRYLEDAHQVKLSLEKAIAGAIGRSQLLKLQQSLRKLVELSRGEA